jgi:hypothetical protein
MYFGSAGMSGVGLSRIEHASHELEEVDAELQDATVSVATRVERAAARVERSELEPLYAARRGDHDRPRRRIEPDLREARRSEGIHRT